MDVIQNSGFRIQERGPAQKIVLVALVCILSSALCMTSVFAQTPNFLTGFSDNQAALTAATRPAVLKDVTFDQRLNQQLPLDATFLDESGRSVQLGQYFNQQKPVVLAFVYYSCPMLCTQIMNGLSGALRGLSLEPGQDFDVVLVSFDPRDTPATAAEKKRTHLDYWKAQATGGGWHFLTGQEPEIKRVANAAGFSYKWDDLTQQYAHVSGVLVITPDGRLSRYFYGVEYSPRDLRMALVESGQGHIGSLVDELILLCFHYDPMSGRYGVIVMNLLRAGGVLTVLFILGVMYVSRRREPPVAEGRA